jgi:hypothetical protein
VISDDLDLLGITMLCESLGAFLEELVDVVRS